MGLGIWLTCYFVWVFGFCFCEKRFLEFSGITVYNPYGKMDLLKEDEFLMAEKEFDIQGEVLDRYSNFVHISSSFFDFTLRFGLVEDLKSEQNKLSHANFFKSTTC